MRYGEQCISAAQTSPKSKLSSWRKIISWVIHPLLRNIAIPGDGRLLLQLGHRDLFFFPCTLYVFPYSHLFSTFFVSFFILLHFCFSQARVFGKMLLHEFHISYSHTEWFLRFSRCQIVRWPKLHLPIKVNLNLLQVQLYISFHFSNRLKPNRILIF